MAHERLTTNPLTPAQAVGEPVMVRVTMEHHIALARQTTRALVGRICFAGTAVHQVLTAVSELAGNLCFHATRGGTISLVIVKRNAEFGIEVITEDDGPGIPDVGRAMRDGFSTKGGLGGGLPGVERLMDEFQITSTVGVGTRIVARKWAPWG